jgi:hypothetical protein
MFTGGRDQDELFNSFRVGNGILDANRSAEGMANKDELLREFLFLGDGVYIADHFTHGVLSKRGIALPVTS